ncbi:hypothetical protein [Phytopseudomonas punonensis]|uniref:Uncharacterized protein n=1 Tax=Phytopseudomonas punonensis TaxID=1220495 RepID=A0A1M6Z7U8_9GAMM|nr:hypothetical protein [Pseudomonas punonensis]SHL26534.1 hypothetical protein SAMN05216288_1511 [Pseudomonas punonensis]
MKLDEVPQDPDSAYGGHSKLLYAVDDKGHYTGAKSAGWEAESFSTQLAVAELQAQEAEAYAGWQRGELSPLKCLMFRYRMDEPALAQISGLWQWRVRRHFRPQIYRRLSDSVLGRYAEAFGLTVAELRRYQKELP